MNLAAAVTIAVYFVGLVNFYPRSGGGREVILPLATTRKVHEVTLETHTANIVITELDGGAAACTMPWQWKDADPMDPTSVASCTIEGVSGQEMTLPPSSQTFSTTVFDRDVPKLKSLCCAIGDIDHDYLTDRNQYAVRLTLTNGTLGACKAGSAWVSTLTLDGNTGAFSISGSAGTKNGTLKDQAVVYIINAPPFPPDPSQEKHFWWYYVMYTGATGCTNLPGTTREAADVCPDGVVLAMAHHFGIPGASSAGCSNTAYP